MTTPEELPALPSTRVRLERLADGLRLTLGTPGRGYSCAFLVLVFGLAVSLFAVVSLSLMNWRANGFVLGMTCLALVLSGSAVLVSSGWLLVQSSSPSLGIRGDRLQIRVGGLLTRRRWEWPRTALRAVVADRGLWIVAEDGILLLFQTRPEEEIAWVAEVLRRTLTVSDQLALRPEELAVEYMHEPEEKYLPAVLCAEPGRMSLWAVQAPFSRYLFYPGSESLFQTWSPLPGVRQSRLTDEDVTLRIWPNGAGSLRVRPAGTRLRLTIWCKQGHGLAEALGRFRGGREDAERPEE